MNPFNGIERECGGWHSGIRGPENPFNGIESHSK